MKTIKGNIAPKAEEKNFYELSDFIPDFGTPLFTEKEKYVWTLFKQTDNQWVQVANNVKYGKKVPYTFGEKVIGIPYKIMVHNEVINFLKQKETKKVAQLIVTPISSKEPAIGRVILLNKGKENVNKANFNENLTAEARTSNLVGRQLTFYLWEEGAPESDKYKNPKYSRVDKNGIASVQFNMMEYASQNTIMDFFRAGSSTKKFFVTAVFNNKKVNNKEGVEVSKTSPPNSKTGNSSDGLIGLIGKAAEVVANGIENVVSAAKDGLTATSVNQNSQKNTEDDVCPRCKKLTEDELKAVFPSVTNTTLITEIVKSFNEYCEKFNVNTCTLKAHFFAQAKQESGNSLVPAINGESMDYKISALKTTGFLNVSASYMFGNKNGIKMADDLGRKKDEGALSIDRQIKIANFVYGLNPKAKSLGNKAPANNQDLSEENNEGWRFRGRGMLQITGRNNYADIEAHVNKTLNEKILNIKEGRKYNDKFTATEALLSGLGDWDLHKMYIPAKSGVTEEACLNVIKIINSKTKSKTKRIAHLLGGVWYEDDKTTEPSHTIKEKDSMKSIFRVKECKKLNPVDEAITSDEEGVLNKMKKIADQHHTYKQETDHLRTDDSAEGLSKMDCSEFVSRYLHELGITSSIKYMTTDNMVSEKAFRQVIGNNNIDFVIGSDGKDFSPQRGDIFVWRRSDAGHTGIVYSYDSANDVVVILEAIGNVGAVSEKDQVKNGGYAGTGCSRTAKYKRLKGALWGHGGWKGYFRPKNYTKKL